MLTISTSRSRIASNAIRLPSGDQAGFGCPETDFASGRSSAPSFPEISS
jgi:hypothetical protein